MQQPHCAFRRILMGKLSKSCWRSTPITLGDRGTVWARRGEAKLAQALEHLAVIAGAVPLPANEPTIIAEAYASEGWKVDAGCIDGTDIARTGVNHDAVAAALGAVYLPWLDSGAAALQGLAAQGKVPFAQPAKPPKPPANSVLIFVDGLRMDLAHRLSGVLQANGAKTVLNWRWSGFPTVTATCKPLASPAAGAFAACAVEALAPELDGKPVTKLVLMKAITATGWVTDDTLLGTDPVWLEAGKFDDEGHKLGARLAGQIADVVAKSLRSYCDWRVKVAACVSSRIMAFCSCRTVCLLPSCILA